MNLFFKPSLFLFVTATALRSATALDSKLILPSDKGGVTTNSSTTWIVYLKNCDVAAESLDTTADMYASSIDDLKIENTFDALCTFEARGSLATMSTLLSEHGDNIEKIVQDFELFGPGSEVDESSDDAKSSEDLRWHLDRIDQRDSSLDGLYDHIGVDDASGVDIYDIGAGINEGHVEFLNEDGTSRATYSEDYCGDCVEQYVCDGWSTYTSGITMGNYGVAKKAPLFAYRTGKCDGATKWVYVIRAANKILSEFLKKGRPAVVTMYAVGSFDHELNSLMTYLTDAGMVVVVPGGRDTNACDNSPAAAVGLITVSGFDKTGDTSGMSYGRCIDIYAPGEDIVGPWIGSSNEETRSYGSAWAAVPQVVGAAALLLSEGVEPQNIKSELISMATTGKLTNLREGSPDKMLFVGKVDEKIHMAGEAGITGSWIVTMDGSMSESGVKELSQDIGDLSVEKVYSVISAFHATGNLEKIEELVAKYGDLIVSVHQDEAVEISAPEWGLDRVDQRDLPLDNQPLNVIGVDDAAGVNAYIIDTGVLITHDEFKDSSGVSRATWGTNTADTTNDDCHGHGTHVAGSVAGKTYGVARKANIIAVKVLSCSGSGTWSGVIDGVNWVFNDAKSKEGVKATANMSLGGGKYQLVNDAVNNLHNSGVVTVVAAGNSDADACNYSPASEPVVLTVGATDSTDARAGFSNFGTCVDMFAPGVLIKSAWIGSDSTTATISGTSMASPHVCGGAALVLSTGESPANVESVLKTAATPNKVTDPQGSPNLLLFVGKEGTDPCVENPEDKFCLANIDGSPFTGGPFKCGWITLLSGPAKKFACTNAATCEGYGSAAEVCWDTCDEYQKYKNWENEYTCKSLSKRSVPKREKHCANTENGNAAKVCFSACGTCPE